MQLYGTEAIDSPVSRTVARVSCRSLSSVAEPVTSSTSWGHRLEPSTAHRTEAGDTRYVNSL